MCQTNHSGGCIENTLKGMRGVGAGTEQEGTRGGFSKVLGSTEGWLGGGGGIGEWRYDQV